MTSALPPTAPPPPLDPPGWQPPPPPSPPPVRPQLRRSGTDRILGGVNGGLAEYSGIDALLWRVGFVALTLAAGTGVIVYLLLWVLMPAGPPGPAAGDTELRQKVPAAPRSPVPGVTIAGLLIVVGILTLISSLTDWDPGPRVFLGAALLVVGVGLVAAAFTGGRTARGGLIALGVVLSLALIAAASGPWHGNSGGVGERIFRPATPLEVRDVYRGNVGDMLVDLSQVDVSDLDGEIVTRIEHGLGNLEIVLPRSADVRLSVDHALGSLEVFDRGAEADGFFPGSGSQAWTDDDEPEFVLTVNSGAGDVEVSRG